MTHLILCQKFAAPPFARTHVSRWHVDANGSTGFLRLIFLVLIALLLAATAAMAQNQVPPGVAPVAVPNPRPAGSGSTNGFGIDGDLRAYFGDALIYQNAGDWLPDINNFGGVLSSTGAEPPGPDATRRIFHRTDNYGTADDVFEGGSKINSDPRSSVSWKIGGPNPSKNDIQNALVYITEQVAVPAPAPAGTRIGDTWVMMSGDRATKEGNSFLAFQFLQKTLTKNTNGTFSSAGTDGGRTVGDIQVTAEFVNGGTMPNLFYEVWQQVGSGFTWVPLPNPPAGAAYGRTNGVALTGVPYNVFGSNTYSVNLFAEVAVDISAVYRSVSTGCAGKISTLWIVTKSSQSPTANMTDFINPIQLNLDLTTPANAGPDRAICVGGSTTLGTAVVPADPDATYAWRIKNTTTVLATTPEYLVSPTATTEYTLTVTKNGCDGSDDVKVTVNPLPTANAGTAPAAKCLVTTGTPFQLDGSGSNGTLLWTVKSASPTTLDASFSDATAAKPIVTVTGGSGTVTLLLTVTSNSTPACGTATSEVTVTVNPLPTANAGAAPDAQCFLATGNAFQLNGSGTNGTFQWTVKSASPTTLGASFSDATAANPTVTVTGGSGTVTLLLTVTSNSTPACGTATSEVTVTVNAQAKAPQTEVLQPDLCSTSTMSLALRVTNPEHSTTYTLTQPNVALSATNPRSITTPASGTLSVLFENLVPGGGYSIKAAKGLCESETASCPPARMATEPAPPTAPQQPIKLEAYPNPTSRDATILFSVPTSGHVVLSVYDALGRQVATLFDGQATAGEQRTVVLKGENLSSGDYYYRVTANGKTKTSRISLAK